MATFNADVANSTDDAEEKQDGSSYSDNSSRVQVDAGTGSSATRITGGFRWDGVTIAPAATISAATANLYVSSGGTDIDATVGMDDSDDSLTFSSTDTPHDRTVTSATITWDDGSLGSNAQNTSPDFTAVVQEIVDRGSWLSGNAMTLILAGNSGSVSLCDFRSQDSSTGVREIDITYTVGGDDVVPLVGGGLVNRTLVDGGLVF